MEKMISLQQKKNKRDRAASMSHPTVPIEPDDRIPFSRSNQFLHYQLLNATTEERVLLIPVADQEGNTFSRLGNVKSKSTSGTSICDSFLLGYERPDRSISKPRFMMGI